MLEQAVGKRRWVHGTCWSGFIARRLQHGALPLGSPLTLTPGGQSLRGEGYALLGLIVSGYKIYRGEFPPWFVYLRKLWASEVGPG